MSTVRLRQNLAQGALLREAIRPHIAKACRAALAPTVATMTTIGLASLPGMMTGVIMGGASPTVTIKYQIVIMICIFSGTAITVALGLWLTSKRSFTPLRPARPNDLSRPVGWPLRSRLLVGYCTGGKTAG